MKKHLDAILRSYAKILYLPGTLAGAFCFAITFFEPNLACCGLIAVMTAYGFAKLLRLDQTLLDSGFYIYNPLLIGLAVGYLFQLSFFSAGLIIVSSLFTLIFTVNLSRVFYQNFQLPILSVPFIVISPMVYLASSKFESLFVSGLAVHWHPIPLQLALPFWLNGFLSALGAILFLPHALPGLGLALILLSTSRILFLLALLGYYLGTVTTGILIGSFEQACANIFHFNFILIAMAVGGIFTVASPRSFALASLAVLISIFVLKATEVFWASYGMPPGLSISFNFMVLSFIYFLGLIKYPEMADMIHKTPEDTLDYYLSNQKRYSHSERTLDLPFSGKWTVWQSFQDKWTHQGSWQYAYDFLITGEEGKTFQDAGGHLSDYYAYQKTVFSPAAGQVVRVVHDLEDNPIGHIDKENPWGNLVILYDARGFYVEISHFAKNSITVKPGDWVVKGTVLGRCGNSGNSPQPHIHIQAQTTEEIGASTLPFVFSHYILDKQLFMAALPPRNSEIQSMPSEKNLERNASLALDDEFTFQIFKKGNPAGRLNLRVFAAEDGTFYFSSGSSRLYFGRRDHIFYIYSLAGGDRHLKNLFLALPRMPLGYLAELKWNDDIPLNVCAEGWRWEILRFFRAFFRSLGNIQAEYRFVSPKRIQGRIKSRSLNMDTETGVELSAEKGIERFFVKDYQYILIPKAEEISPDYFEGKVKAEAA